MNLHFTPAHGSKYSYHGRTRRTSGFKRSPVKLNPTTPSEHSGDAYCNGDAAFKDIPQPSIEDDPREILESMGEGNGISEDPLLRPRLATRMATIQAGDNTGRHQRRGTIKKRIAYFITTIMAAYFGISAILAPFLPLDGSSSQSWVNINVAQAADTAPREPLGLFKDYSHLFRAWARFSASRAMLTLDMDLSRDRNHVVPVLAELLREGDLWNRLSGEFSFAAEPFERTIGFDRSNRTHVDLAALEQRLTASMDEVNSMFMKMSWTLRDGQGHLEVLSKRIASIRDDALSQHRGADPGGFRLGSNSNQTDDAYLESFHPLQLLQLFQETKATRDLSEGFNGISELTNRMHLSQNLTQVLEQVRTLHIIIAHTASNQLLQAVGGVTWIDWAQSPLLNRLLMVFRPESLLLKATEKAVIGVALGEKRKKYTELLERVRWLMGTLSQMIQCESALEEHTKMLVSAAKQPGVKTDSPYVWLPDKKAWLTVRSSRFFRKNSANKLHPRSLPDCAPLNSFPYYRDPTIQIEENVEVNDEMVLKYVPMPRYISNLLKEDFLWMYNMERKLMHEPEDFTRW